MLRRLAQARLAHAVTGSLAATRLAPVAPPRLATLYVEEMDSAGRELDLRPADAGANVLLIEPSDASVFWGARTDEEGVRWAAPVQVAADLLTGPGRAPAEAEALLEWMASNEEAWRG